jgi:hypothetical protein
MIKLLTFNTQLLPGFISQNKPEQRAMSIADLIIQRKYDIVCLQGEFTILHSLFLCVRMFDIELCMMIMYMQKFLRTELAMNLSNN